METLALLLVIQICQGCELDRYNASLLSRLLIINPGPSEFVYKVINDQLYASLLAEDQFFADIVVDLLTLILVQMKNTNRLEKQREDIRASLQALIECCFGYNQNEDPQKRLLMQERCLTALN